MERRKLTDVNLLQPEYHLPLNIELQTVDHRATLTTLERHQGRRKVTTHSRGRTLKNIQETTRGYQEVFSYKPLRQRSKTATFQEHLMQFRPCAQMTYGETQLNLPLRGENWYHTIQVSGSGLEGVADWFRFIVLNVFKSCYLSK